MHTEQRRLSESEPLHYSLVISYISTSSCLTNDSYRASALTTQAPTERPCNLIAAAHQGLHRNPC
jgi:hypothetical protein